MKKGFTKRMLAFVIALAVVAATFAIPTESSAAAKKKVVVKGAVSNTIVIAKKKSATLKLVNESNKSIKNTDCKFVVSKGKNVVKVTKKGKVTAKKVGTASIKITNKKTKASTTLKVVVPKTAVKSVKLNSTKLTLNNSKKTATLKVTFNPKKPTCKLVTWSTSNKKVAKVDAKGKVTAVAPGTATITVKSLDGNKKATCKVTVTKAKKVALDKTAETIGIGGTATLKATVTPAKYFGKVTWKSSDEKVATVKNGKVTAVAVGEAKITATATGGAKATYTVTVKKSAVKLDKDKLTLDKVGATATLTATIDPANTTDTIKSWTSSNEKIATVDKDGKVTAVAVGSADIVVELTNGNKAICDVTVGVPATKVTAKADKTTIKANETTTITTAVEPANSTDSVEFVYDKNVISIDKDGKVTVVGKVYDKPLKVKVTAKANDKASAEVELTIVGTENAVEEINGYVITLDKAAENYRIKDTTVAGEPAYIVKQDDIIADGKLVAEKFKTATNAATLVNAIGEVVNGSKVGKSQGVTMSYEGGVITVISTGRSKTMTITGDDATSIITVVCGGKTTTINILDARNSDKSTKILAEVNGKDLVKIVVADDGSSIEVQDVNANNAKIASYKVTDKAIKISVNNSGYQRLLKAFGMSDLLKDSKLTIENNYNK